MRFWEKTVLYGSIVAILCGISPNKSNSQVIKDYSKNTNNLESIVRKDISKQEDTNIKKERAITSSIGGTLGMYNLDYGELAANYGDKPSFSFGADGEINISPSLNLVSKFRYYSKSSNRGAEIIGGEITDETHKWIQYWITLGGRYYIKTGNKDFYPFVGLEGAYVNIEEKYDLTFDYGIGGVSKQGSFSNNTFGLAPSGGIKFFFSDNASLNIEVMYLSADVEGEGDIIVDVSGLFVGATLSIPLSRR